MVSPLQLQSSVALVILLSQMFMVWSGQIDSLMARIIVRVRKRRSENWDFTQLNQNVCPPSLCRSLDEVTGETKDRPKGTGGTVFYQGDIVLDKKMGRFIYPQTKTSRRRKRATMRRRSRLWRSGVVVYKMSRSISDEAKAVFERAINHIQKRTCITFRTKEDKDKDFIRFISEPGCWSQIGRVGGVQMVSLGRGCESLGTAVHELVHALGIWHEQARPDRDKFVEIVEDNISEKFLPDFEVVGRRVSTARGYPYDYQSLMHYSKFAFTKNGKPTIKVIGIGEKLKMRIGQRRGLSTIDLAQLRDMYKCNQATDANEAVCHKDWVKLKGTCYKFFPDTKAQFGPASSTCYDLKSHLLTIDSRQEQKVITRYVNKKFRSIQSWRTAGKMVNNIMMWYLGPSIARNITRYTNWAKGHPGVYTSAILIRDDTGDAFEWKGEWSGSSSQKPAYEHAFICEKTAKRKCINGRFPDGRGYRGLLDHTRDGYTCQKWTDNYPHQHKLVEAAKKGATLEAEEDRDGLGDHNWCRNPSGLRRNRPWCFTAKAKHEWGYCDVSICAKYSQSEKQSTVQKLREIKGSRGTKQTLRDRLHNRRRGNTLRRKTRHKKTTSTVAE